jgi:hypothetical protein
MVKTESRQHGMASDPGSEVIVALVREPHHEYRRNPTSLRLRRGGLTHKPFGENDITLVTLERTMSEVSQEQGHAPGDAIDKPWGKV